MKREDLKIIPNLRAFEVQYKGPTNESGSRVIIRDLRFRVSKTIGYNYEFDNAAEIAQAYLLTKGIEICFKAEGKECYIMLTDNFTNQIK